LPITAANAFIQALQSSGFGNGLLCRDLKNPLPDKELTASIEVKS